MDNRLTKKRLSDFLAYEWILVIIVAVAAIIVWELVYTVSAVRLTTGQSFKYYYDENVAAVKDDDFYNMLKKSNAFGYDVKELSSESLTSEYNVLSTRLSVYEGDAIFTDCIDGEDGSNRAKDLTDAYGYNYERLLSDAKAYVAAFTDADGTLNETKIEENFNKRANKRVYKNALKADEISLADEIKRIEKLVDEIADFEKLLNSDVENLFFRYTKFEQSANNSTDGTIKDDYVAAAEREKAEGRENAIYGLNLGALKGGKKDITEYVKRAGESTADGVTLLIFDFKDEQPDLQYEAIGFINAIVRDCSDILSAI